MEARERLEREMWIFSNETRLQMIHILNTADLCGRDIGEILDIRQPNVSKHTEKMVELGIITEYKIGRRVFYHLNDDVKAKYPGIFKQIKNVYGEEITRKQVRTYSNKYKHKEQDIKILLGK